MAQRKQTISDSEKYHLCLSRGYAEGSISPQRKRSSHYEGGGPEKYREMAFFPENLYYHEERSHHSSDISLWKCLREAYERNWEKYYVSVYKVDFYMK